MSDQFYKELKKLKDIKIYNNINVKDDSNLKIDAVFAYKIEIYSFLIVKNVFKIIKKHHKKYYVIGKGSNVLFAKSYYDGVLVKMHPINMKDLNVVGAGDSLNYINEKYLKLGICSLDFLSGVPCSIGGAIFMNAGAFNQSMADIVEYVYCYDINEEKFKVFDNEKCKFDYRKSLFQTSELLILGAKIKLEFMDKDKVKNIHIKRLKTRSLKLPLEYPNLGSIFKNPQCFFAGQLIESAGLKGLKLSGCMISEKHANVIVNFDNCRGNDVLELINIIKDEIYMKYKILLEEEIIVFK
jgi:UDP-N-acetylmuramate dehydrogenase